MLSANYIKDNLELIKDRLTKRGFKEMSLLDEVVSINDERKALQAKKDTLKQQANLLSKEIGGLYKSGKREEADKVKNEKIPALNKELSEIGEKHKAVALALDEILFKIPNIPHESVPAGVTEQDNEVFKPLEGDLPELPESSKPHWELAKEYDIIDFELGVKITGAGFPVYKGQGARLQRALINFFLDHATDAGYLEIQPPHLVNESSARATGQLPDKEGQMYYIPEDDLYLIPTGEVPVTNILRDVMLEEKDLPVKLTGYTPCFRREAGSYGKDVRGLNRVHQFDKVEVVQVVQPSKSYEVLEEMVAHVESLLNKLELPYRILRLCGGDLGFTSALTFDFETYSAAQKRWLEVSSVSNFETFQANRLKVRYKDADKKTQLCHTLNGSALALARIVATLLENNQTDKGIKIPKLLVPYTGFEYITK